MASTLAPPPAAGSTPIRATLACAIYRGGDRSRAPDRRPASSSLGPRRPALSDRGDHRRHRLRPQHHRNRLCRGPLDVSRRRPEAFRPVGEVEFANGAAAMSASGGYGPAAMCAGIVGHVDLLRGDGAKPVLEAEIDAGNGRFRGIRHSSAWDADPEIAHMYATRPKGLLLDATFRKGFARLAPLGLTFDAWLFHPQIARSHRSGPRLSRTNESSSIIAAARSGSAALPASARKHLQPGRPRSRKSPNAPTSWSSSAGWRCGCSAMIFTNARSRRRRNRRPRHGVPISKPASRPSAPTAACSKATFRRTRASAAIR